MRRILLAVVLLGLVSTVGLFTVPSVPAAQDATPAGEAAPLTLETLGTAPSIDAPGMMQILFRVTVAPGGVVPSHIHPGQIIVAVQSGTLTYTVLGGEGETLRGGAGTPTAEEAITPGTEVVFGPGDWFIEHPAVVHTARNTGDEPAVLLISGLVAADQPFLQPMEMDMATPAA